MRPDRGRNGRSDGPASRVDLVAGLGVEQQYRAGRACERRCPQTVVCARACDDGDVGDAKRVGCCGRAVVVRDALVAGRDDLAARRVECVGRMLQPQLDPVLGVPASGRKWTSRLVGSNACLESGGRS
jgi:hypothetical protein